MARLTKLKVKDDSGNFPNTYPIGAEAENVILKNGNTVEEEINNINQDIVENKNDLEKEITDTKNDLEKEITDTKADLEKQISDTEEELQKNIDTKAPIYHASETTEYGLGDEEKYGHLKITDEYTELNDDSSYTALSLTGIVDLFNRYLQIFQVLNNADEAGQMLYSAFNTGYRKDAENSHILDDENLMIKDDETLYLISKYFDIEDNDTSHQTLIINIKDSY